MDHSVKEENFLAEMAKWFVQTIKRPTKAATTNKYFGLASLLINVLLVSTAAHMMINRIFSVLHMINSDVPTGISLFVRIFIAMIVFFGVQIAAGFGMYRQIIKDSTNIYKFMNRIATFSNLMIIVGLVFNLFVVMIGGISSMQNGGFRLAIYVLVGLLSIIWVTSYSMAFSFANIKDKFDRIQTVLVTVVANHAVLALTGYICFKIIQGMAK
ncbi:DUF6574 domain-containing protein [Companilactobacillus mishanensis]|uniref:Yip1 domain-containing protein n=1 Tax=Companilactobacillus mishanensis TaxID=2486008 RepID=A0A5P0ZJ52_9LACO|nr:hypothetical protein [Companilactobacillus mishanensis]MQS53123.1 hypothetical protein [Companilactobacillus mishanensis]